VAKYSEAIELDPSNHVYFSNRRCVPSPNGSIQSYTHVLTLF
jgi:hypothetical protein